MTQRELLMTLSDRRAVCYGRIFLSTACVLWSTWLYAERDWSKWMAFTLAFCTGCGFACLLYWLNELLLTVLHAEEIEAFDEICEEARRRLEGEGDLLHVNRCENCGCQWTGNKGGEPGNCPVCGR